MLYWLGVYMLVIAGVAVPSLLLYFVGVCFSLALRAICFVMRNLKETLTAGPDLSRAQ
jgi:hypothetical protein